MKSLKIERVSVATLIPDPANVRRHGPRNLDSIKGSLTRFGQQKPIVVSKDNVVVAGNGTLEAAKALGWTEIDIIRSSLKGPEATAFAIADNRTAELAIWDDDGLKETLHALQEENEALFAATGFTDAELTVLFPDDDVNAPDKADDREKLPEIKYSIVFDDQQQQDSFFAFLRHLKSRYPEFATTGSRLQAFIDERDFEA